MKLYTEKQVKEIVHRCMTLDLSAETLLPTLTPISLPGNEDIAKKSFQYYADNFWAKLRFQKGANWVIEQIKKQIM